MRANELMSRVSSYGTGFWGIAGRYVLKNMVGGIVGIIGHELNASFRRGNRWGGG